MTLILTNKYFEKPKTRSVERVLDILNNGKVLNLEWKNLILDSSLSKKLAKDSNFKRLHSSDNKIPNNIKSVLVGISNGTVVTGITLISNYRCLLDVVYGKNGYTEDKNLSEYLTSMEFLDIYAVVLNSRFVRKSILTNFIDYLFSSSLPFTISANDTETEKMFSVGKRIELRKSLNREIYSNYPQLIEDYINTPEEEYLCLSGEELTLSTNTYDEYVGADDNYKILYIESLKKNELLHLTLPSGEVYKKTTIPLIYNNKTKDSRLALPINIKNKLGSEYIGLNYILNNTKCNTGILRLDETLSSVDIYKSGLAFTFPFARRINRDNITDSLDNPDNFINPNFSGMEMYKRFKLVKTTIVH